MGKPTGHGSIYDDCPFTAIDEVPTVGNTTAKMHGGLEPSGGAGMEELNDAEPLYGYPRQQKIESGRPRMWQPKGKPRSHEDYEG